MKQIATPVLITLAAPERSTATLLFHALTALALFVWRGLEGAPSGPSRLAIGQHLLVSKRHHGIDLNRSPRGDVNRYRSCQRQKSDTRQNDRQTVRGKAV